MITFWLAAATLTLASLGVVLWPLLRRHQPRPPAPAESALGLYRAQLAAIDHELETGLIAPPEAERLRWEIKRRMLAVAATGAPADAQAASAPARPRALAAMLAIAIPIAAFVSYLALGIPGERDQPLAERSPATTAAAIPGDERAAAEKAVAMLTARLAKQPDDPAAWRLLGRALRLIGRPADAVIAYRHALASQETAANAGDATTGDAGTPNASPPQDASTWAELGEALIAAAGGRVDDEAAAALTKAVAADPHEPRANYYLALKQAQDGDIEGALRGWLALIASAPADAPWLPQVRQQAERAAAALGLPPGSIEQKTAPPDAEGTPPLPPPAR